MAAGAWVRASVVTDGAAVYEKPDFDSTAQDYVRFQTAVSVSKRPFAGLGGLGLFHKVRYGKKSGYIADTDIKIGGKADGPADVGARGERKSAKKKKSSWGDEGNDMKTPVFLTRYLGAALASVGFSEIYQGHKLQQQMMMFGLRMSGPNTLGLPLPLDLNIWFGSKPSYLATFGGGGGSGFLVFGDLGLQLPAVNLDDWMVTYGLGLMYTYTRFKIPVKRKSDNKVFEFDSQELRLGVDFGLGVGARIKKVLLRGDLKYFLERTQYIGFVASAQLEF